MRFELMFCSVCKDYTVHEGFTGEDLKCLRHNECKACHAKIQTGSGHYRMNDSISYCEACGDKIVTPGFVL